MKKLFDLSKNPIISEETAALQTKTCQAIVELLVDNPGVILGDDVGMGKTYIAFATAVCYLKKHPDKSIVIITPSWLMNEKWYKDILDFIDVNLNITECSLSVSDIGQIAEKSQCFVEAIRQAAQDKKVLLIPINALAAMSWKREKSFYLACWFRHRSFREDTRKRLLKALGGDQNKINPNDFAGMGITYQQIPKEWYQDLDALDLRKQDKATIDQIWEELKNLRYRAINAVLPDSSLLILDEAHKMKNAETVKRVALETSIAGRFGRGIFLTATPFQLGESELRSVLEMFQGFAVSAAKKRMYNEKIETLFTEMNRYISLMVQFEQFVKGASPADCVVLERLVHGQTVPDTEQSNDIRETFDTFRRVIQQKDVLEKVMRTVVVRNVKPKDAYRHEIVGVLQDGTTTGIPLSEENYLVFAMIEKAIHQILQKGDRTFIASVKQSFTSSYSAAQAVSVYKLDLPALNILHKMPLHKISHPKMTCVSDEVARSLKKGEKTLVFCGRLESIKELKDSITKNLDKAYQKDISMLFPSQTPEKDFETFRKRFSSPQDVAWFMLQENYIYSVLVPLLEMCGESQRMFPTATDILDEVERLYTEYNRTVKINYRYLKRIVEQVTFRHVLAKLPKWHGQASENIRLTIANILNPQYIKYGLNLVIDEEEMVTEEIDDAESRSISVMVIGNILSYKGLWAQYAGRLNQILPSERDDLVSSMIAWLRRDRRFFVELRKMEKKNPDKERAWQIEHTFMSTKTRGDVLDWDRAFADFLETYTGTPGEGSKSELRLGIKHNEMVEVITGSTSNETRQKNKAGFNTPFYPQVLITTATMQEGVDLQRECRRVVHYDLDWNPASLEQRNGRIDRIGSLTAKRREDDKTIFLDIFYPYIKNTIDESIYKTVKDREKWFNLLMGGTPQWDTFEVDPDVTSIPVDIFRAVQIDLSV